MAFYGCHKIKSITIPKDTEFGSADSFWSCISLEEVLVEDGHKDLFSEDGCVFQWNYEGRLALKLIPAGKIAYTIPENVELLEGYTFPQGCQLRELTLLSHSPELIPYSFDNFCELKRFNVSPDNDLYTEIDGVLYSKDLKTIICYPSGKTDETYNIVNGTTKIGDGCFNTSLFLKRMTVPEGIDELGYSSFFDCRHMESITFPSSLIRINGAAFQHCRPLKTITCFSLTPPIVEDDYVFYDVTPDQVLVPAGSVDSYKAAPVWKSYASVIKAIE